MAEINAHLCTISFIYKLVSNNYKLITISDEYATNNTSAGAFSDAEHSDYGGECIEEKQARAQFQLQS